MPESITAVVAAVMLYLLIASILMALTDNAFASVLGAIALVGIIYIGMDALG